MNNNRASLDGIVSRIKEQGINAGEQEKQRIIEDARKQAKQILSDAQRQSNDIIEQAKASASQLEKNSKTAIAQASRDMIEATKTAILQNLKAVFGQQCESLFTQQQYMEKILEVVLESIPGNKTVKVPEARLKDMESYLLKHSMDKGIDLKPLAGSEAKIVVNLSENGELQYVLSAKDVEDGLFSLLNKELVHRITQTQGT